MKAVWAQGVPEPEPSHGAGRGIGKMEKALVTTMRSLQGTTANKTQLSSYDKVTLFLISSHTVPKMRLNCVNRQEGDPVLLSPSGIELRMQADPDSQAHDRWSSCVYIQVPLPSLPALSLLPHTLPLPWSPLSGHQQFS